MPTVPAKTEYRLVKAVPEQGRVESNIMRSGKKTHRFTSNNILNTKTGKTEKASCHVRGLTDQQAADAYPVFYEHAKWLGSRGISLLTEEGRRQMQVAIIGHAGAGTPGTVRIHQAKPEVVAAQTAPVPDQNTVTLDALRALAADSSLSPSQKQAAMSHLLNNQVHEATPAMIAAMAYTQAMDAATKASRK